MYKSAPQLWAGGHVAFSTDAAAAATGGLDLLDLGPLVGDRWSGLHAPRPGPSCLNEPF